MELKVPRAQGMYAPAIRHGDLIFTSGMTPRENGQLMFTGPLEAAQDIQCYRDAVRLAAFNVVAAARGKLGPEERISAIVSSTVFLNCEPGFTAHTKVADFASSYFVELIGTDILGTRCAVGVSSLPGGAPVEIQIVAAVARVAALP